MKNAIIVYSGGMDSTVLLIDSLRKYHSIIAISFDYGSKHNARELPKAKAVCQNLHVPHHIISLPFVNDLFSSTLLQSGEDIPDGQYFEESMKSTVVPFRNGIMLSVATGFAESRDIDTVLLGSHSGDHAIYPDCRPVFNEAFAKAAFNGTYNNVQIRFPFSGIDKREIADIGRKLNVDFSETWTCYKGKEKHCGVCGACTERKYALRHNEGLDPTEYEI